MATQADASGLGFLACVKVDISVSDSGELRKPQVPLSYSFYNRIPLTRALGQLPLRICDMGCDYYVANCHKWMLCCRGSGFMYGAIPSCSDFM